MDHILYEKQELMFFVSQYQSTTDLPVYFDESPAPVQRLFAILPGPGADVLESFVKVKAALRKNVAAPPWALRGRNIDSQITQADFSLAATGCAAMGIRPFFAVKTAEVLREYTVKRG